MACRNKNVGKQPVTVGVLLFCLCVPDDDYAF